MSKLLTIIIAASVITVQFLPEGLFFIFSGAIFLIIIYLQPKILRRFRNKMFWAFMIIITLIQPVILGEKNASIAGVGYSTINLILGLKITVRALVIMAFVNYMFTRVKRQDLNRLMSRLPVAGLDEVLSESRAMYPKLKEALGTEIKVMRWKSLFTMPVSTVSVLLARLIVGVMKETPSPPAPLPVGEGRKKQ